MTFAAQATGGQYIHNHGYQLKYNEYFGTANKIQLWYAKRKESESYWYIPGKIGTTPNSPHTSTNSSGVDTVDTYRAFGATDFNMNTDLLPYQTVYYWRRTA